MLVPVPVIAHGALLGDCLRVLKAYMLFPVFLLRGVEEQLHTVHGLSDVAAAALGDILYNPVLKLILLLKVSGLYSDRAGDGDLGVPGTDGLELEYRAPGEYSVENAEIGILCRGGDQGDTAVFDKLEQALLLFLVEVLDLIEIEQDSAGGQESVELGDYELDISAMMRATVVLPVPEGP